MDLCRRLYPVESRSESLRFGVAARHHDEFIFFVSGIIANGKQYSLSDSTVEFKHIFVRGFDHDEVPFWPEQGLLRSVDGDL